MIKDQQLKTELEILQKDYGNLQEENIDLKNTLSSTNEQLEEFKLDQLLCKTHIINNNDENKSNNLLNSTYKDNKYNLLDS